MLMLRVQFVRDMGTFCVSPGGWRPEDVQMTTDNRVKYVASYFINQVMKLPRFMLFATGNVKKRAESQQLASAMRLLIYKQRVRIRYCQRTGGVLWL